MLISNGSKWAKNMKHSTEKLIGISGIGTASTTGMGEYGKFNAYLYSGDKSVLDPDMISSLLEAKNVVYNRHDEVCYISGFMNKKNKLLQNRIDGKAWNHDLELGKLEKNGLYYYSDNIMQWLADIGKNQTAK